MPRRSVLFTPGNRRDMLEGALESAADVVVFDLEDGVAPADKPAARETVVETLTEAETIDDPEVLVRLNPFDAGGSDDIEALAPLADVALPDGFVLPKVTYTAEVREARAELAEVDLDGDLWCLIESPAGLLEAASIAESTGVTALVFGGEDYATAVGGDRTEAGTEVLYPRQHVVAAAAAAGIDAIDGITTALEDAERVHDDAALASTFGFDGKLAVHPAQLEPINEAFTPDPARVEWARRVVDAVEASDEGVLRVDGEMIDAPLINRAKAILDAAEE